VIGRRLWAGLLLAASVAVASAQHHEDLGFPLAGRVSGTTDRFISDHGPCSKGEHWHSVVRVKDHPCLACQGSRLAGIAAEPRRETPISIRPLADSSPLANRLSGSTLSNGSRAPPALL
jgi:hypothetical protein